MSPNDEYIINFNLNRHVVLFLTGHRCVFGKEL